MYAKVSSHLVRRRWAGDAQRGFATVRKFRNTIPIGQELYKNLPTFEDDEVGEEDPRAEARLNEFLAKRKPITSAHAIDLNENKISAKDSAAINPSGGVVHGQYGELGPEAQFIPLEYLALLRPAAEGAAGVRAITGSGEKGTVLVYGASQANGLAATQLASSAGHAVVAVVGGEHSGNTMMMECIKGLTQEPGTAVPDVFALVKKNFLDLVEGISTGNEGIKTPTADEYLEEFKENLMSYSATFPETLPAAVDAKNLQFSGLDKDREMFRENIEAYLSQFPPGAPPVSKEQLDALFPKDQYEVFRRKFWTQTSDIISGDECHFFSPPHMVKELMEEPGSLPSETYPDAGPFFPYSFSVLNQTFPEDVELPTGGPVLGAVIAVTPELESAAKAIDAAQGIRAKGEALHFLSSAERAAFGSASSVVAAAKSFGAPVCVVGGSLPGLETVTPTNEDVKEVLSAMDVGDDGTTRLNYFVQVYRACDFPFYGEYAVHRASEELGGPRQIIVTK